MSEIAKLEKNKMIIDTGKITINLNYVTHIGYKEEFPGVGASYFVHFVSGESVEIRTKDMPREKLVKLLKSTT